MNAFLLQQLILSPHQYPRTRVSSSLRSFRSFAFQILLNSLPCVYLFHRSLPHLIAQSKQLLALFELLWTKIHLNKCRDVSRRRNVTEGEMKKGNKRYTKRMSLPLSVRTVSTVFFFLTPCTHAYKHTIHVFLKRSFVLKNLYP